MAGSPRCELSGRGDAALAERIAPYRAGYTPQQRRELERRLVNGELLGVVSTDALELGIDIGALDAAICVTFPGTVASLRQMWGRAGRRGRGLAIYVAGEDALDQFFCRHPGRVPGAPGRGGDPRPDNEQLYAAHLLCAAHEAPLGRPTTRSSGRAGGETRGRAGRRGRPARAARRHVRPAPAGRVPGGRRVAAQRRRATRVAIVDAGVGRGDRQRRRRPGALDRPPGRDLPARRAQFEVAALDLDDRRAFVARVRRRLVHAAQARDRHAHRAGARPRARRSACG